MDLDLMLEDVGVGRGKGEVVRSQGALERYGVEVDWRRMPQAG